MPSHLKNETPSFATKSVVRFLNNSLYFVPPRHIIAVFRVWPTTSYPWLFIQSIRFIRNEYPPVGPSQSPKPVFVFFSSSEIGFSPRGNIFSRSSQSLS